MATTDRVTGLSEGIAVKAPVKAATTANITLSGAQTIDGVAVTDGDRVLVKNQSTGSQNGIYNVASGAWSRALDFDTGSDVRGGTKVTVLQGTANALTDYVLTNTDATITIGTTALTFSSLAVAAPSSTVTIADGTVGAPSLRFLNETTTGLYRVGTNVVGVAVGGVSVETIGTRGIVSKAYASVASAATVDLGAQGSPNITITGNTGTSSFGSTAAPGDTFYVRWTGTPTLTHGANLRLPGSVSYTAAANDRAIVKCTSAGSYEVYLHPASGLPVVTPAETKMSGDTVQIVNTTSSAVATGTTVIPSDDTIPQITEGTLFLSRAITPTSSANTLRIDVSIQLSPSATAQVIAALFQDSTANALKAAQVYAGAAGEVRHLNFTHVMTAGTTSSTTFTVRAGLSAAGTITLNGASGARLLGGVYDSSITITEYKA